MAEQIILEYDEQIVRESVNFYYWKHTGFLFFITLFIVLIAFFMTFSLQSWVTGCLGTLILLGFIFSVTAYIVIYKRAMTKFSSMKNKHALLSMTEDNFTLSSDIVTSTVDWKQIKNIWKKENFWVVHFDKGGGYFTLPLKNFSDVNKQFFLVHAEENNAH